MKKYPAIALIELSGVAAGIAVSDAMVKQAPITMLKSGTVSHGNYLILIGGSVAAVEEAYSVGLTQSGKALIDRVFLPDVHQQVHDAVQGNRRGCNGAALGVLETKTVAANILAADAAVKGAEVEIVEIRLADGLDGKAFTLVTGKVEDVEAAVQIAKSAVVTPDCWLSDIVIPNLHPAVAGQIGSATRFNQSELRYLTDGEV